MKLCDFDSNEEIGTRISLGMTIKLATESFKCKILFTLMLCKGLSEKEPSELKEH